MSPLRMKPRAIASRFMRLFIIYAKLRIIKISNGFNWLTLQSEGVFGLIFHPMSDLKAYSRIA
jgi:hypothetical protein